jgi:hypothetical protein
MAFFSLKRNLVNKHIIIMNIDYTQKYNLTLYSIKPNLSTLSLISNRINIKGCILYTIQSLTRSKNFYVSLLVSCITFNTYS